MALSISAAGGKFQSEKARSDRWGGMGEGIAAGVSVQPSGER